MRRWPSFVLISAVATLAVAICGHSAVVAKPAEKAGWSVSNESNKKVVLTYAVAKDAPRLLAFACSRESENFEIVLDGVTGGQANVSGVKLMLRNGTASYEAKGEIGFFTGALSFDSMLIADAKVLRRVHDTLLPVLEGAGPIVLTLRGQTREVPVAGIAEPLKMFGKTCFGS